MCCITNTSVQPKFRFWCPFRPVSGSGKSAKNHGLARVSISAENRLNLLAMPILIILGLSHIVRLTLGDGIAPNYVLLVLYYYWNELNEVYQSISLKLGMYLYLAMTWNGLLDLQFRLYISYLLSIVTESITDLNWVPGPTRMFLKISSIKY